MMDGLRSSKSIVLSLLRRERIEVRVARSVGALTLSHFPGEGIGLWRKFLMSAQLLLLSIAAPLVASAAELRAVTILSYPDRPAKLPLWLAQDGGLFEKHGLKVEIKAPSSGEDLVDRIRRDEAQIYVATAN